MSSPVITEPVRAGSPELDHLLAQVAEGASERERQGVAPYEQIALLRDAGLGRLRIPRAEGGGGATLREFFQTLIALARADSNVAHILRVHFSFVEQQLINPDPGSRARWLGRVSEGRIVGNAISEQNGLTVGPAFRTLLAPSTDGKSLRLDGEKFYSTGSLYADDTQIYAVTPEQRLVAITIPTDREGVTIEDDWDGFGQRLTGTGTTRLAHVRVEPDEVTDFGPVDQSDDEKPANYQGAFLQLYLQAVTAGILLATRDDAAALVRRRQRNFGHAHAEKPAADPQVLQVVGEISADAFAAEAIVLAAADQIQLAADSVQDGVPDAALAGAARLAAANAKVAIDGFSTRTTSALFDAGGASATQAIYNLDRHWRNVRTISTHNPTFLKASVVGDFHVSGNLPPLNGFF